MLATSSVQTLRTAPTATVADLQDVLSDRAQGYYDLTVRTQQLRYDADTGMIEVQGQREFGLRPLALQQVAAKLGIPGSYLAKCDWDLRAQNINHWLDQNRSRSFLLRCDGDLPGNAMRDPGPFASRTPRRAQPQVRGRRTDSHSDAYIERGRAPST